MKYTLIGAVVGVALAIVLPTWLVIVAAIGGIMWLIKGIEAG